jgi:hypothetical protein
MSGSNFTDTTVLTLLLLLGLALAYIYKEFKEKQQLKGMLQLALSVKGLIS